MVMVSGPTTAISALLFATLEGIDSHRAAVLAPPAVQAADVALLAPGAAAVAIVGLPEPRRVAAICALLPEPIARGCAKRMPRGEPLPVEAPRRSLAPVLTQASCGW